MNELGVLLAGGIVRVTAFAALGVALALLFRRRGPAVGGLLTLTTLSGLAALSVLSIGPGPTLWRLDLAEAKQGASPAATSRENVVEPLKPPALQKSWTATFARELVREMQTPQPSSSVVETTSSASPPPWRWPAWLALFVLSAWSFGGLRLALALLAVRRLSSESRRIDDVALRDEIDIFRAELSVGKPVEARVSDQLTTPATIGWLRPVILLPSDWREWSIVELKAVLAHELSHIQRNDYVSGVWAQVCLGLHAYHPLAHWLMSRLRLEQELAADASGAELAGGARLYLESLARLALRRSEPPTAWPVRPFLPTRGTFLRRIEMLRDPKAFQNKPLSAIARGSAILLLGAIAILLSGLRGPSAASAETQSPTNFATGTFDALEMENQGGKFADVFDLSHVPADISAVVVGRFAEVLKRPGFEPLVKMMKEGNSQRRPSTLDLAIDEVEGFAAYIKLNPTTSQRPEPYTTLVRTTVPQDWNKVAGKFIGNPEIVNDKGLVYVRAKGTTGQMVYATIDDRTILFGPEPTVIEVLNAQAGPVIAHDWDSTWARLNKNPWSVAAMFNTSTMNLVLASPPPQNAALRSLLGPLLTETSAYAMSAEVLEKGTILRVETKADSADAATSVKETAGAMVVLAKNAIANARTQALTGANGPATHVLALFNVLDPLLKDAKMTSEETAVSLVAHSKADAVAVTQMLLPAAMASRAAARRAQSINNMKQIGLAMHNYESEKKHFPPAAETPSGAKFPYSWRVAILPYIDAKGLYDEYGFNEPWDSPKNLKLIPKMPRIYAHPSVDPTQGKTSYYVIVGPDTIFPADSTGTPIQQITDGTSNTILAVESRGETPWTKPEDIDFDPKKFPGPALPEIKPFQDNGYVTLFADGSVRFIKKSVGPGVLKALLSKSGGEVISSDKF